MKGSLEGFGSDRFPLRFGKQVRGGEGDQTRRASEDSESSELRLVSERVRRES